MEKEKTEIVEKDNNMIVKTVVFLLVAGLTSLLFFGLGAEEKTQLELISYGVLMFSEFLIYISIIISNKQGNKSMDLFYASVLYAIAAVILNYVFKLTIVKQLVIWNIAIFMVYLIIVVIVTTKKK